jgi:NAD(P)-dependent dehydrogenase (short-subunit alcohol dehydrogenase family)
MNIVITGASRGVGYQAALQLSKDKNNTIYALSRDAGGLKKLTDESGTKTILPILCDITDEGMVSNAVKEITERSAGVDVLINNAGYLINKPFEALTIHDWQRTYAVNVFGVFQVTQKLLSLLRNGSLSTERNIHAHIVNISSMGGIQGSLKFRGLSAYSSSKGALITMTECLSEEMKDEGIRVNCIALGSVETEMFSAAFPGLKASAKADEMGAWVARFSMEGYLYFNGKTLPISTSNP